MTPKVDRSRHALSHAGDFGGNAHRGTRRDSMQTFGGPFQVILARTLTGVQGDILCKVLVALSTVK